MKKLIAALGVFATLALAAPAVAQSLVPVYATSGYTTPSGNGYCPSLSYNLYFGVRDYYTRGQVSALQQFLASQGYHQPITGFFGGVTRNNVAAFQRQYSIYPITGGVGPLTRAKIAQLCGGSIYTGGLSITNVSGPNSLAVNQSGTWIFTTNAPYGSYLSTSVRWGDEGYYPYGTTNAAYASTQITFTHTYQQAGTYTITFTVSDQYGHSTSATQTVYVGANCSIYGNCNPQGLQVTSPTQGQAYYRGNQMPIAWSGLIHQTFALEQDASIIDLYSVQSGKVGTIAIQNGISGNYTWSIPRFPQNYMCAMIYPNGLCGTNIPDGQYYIKVTVVVGSGFDSNATQLASAQSGTFTINGAGCSTNCSVSFSANPTSGQAPLTVQFVSAGPAGSDTGTTVVFGDGTSGMMADGCATGGGACLPAKVVSHTYTSAGTYTAQLRNSSGTTIATTNVYVGTNGQYAVTASPQSGNAPLTTTFSIPNYSGSYFVNFGDGISANLVSGSVSHTYYNRGTYTATFSTDYACLHTSPQCAVAQQNLGSVTVTAY